MKTGSTSNSEHDGIKTITRVLKKALDTIRKTFLGFLGLLFLLIIFPLWALLDYLLGGVEDD
jgi:uncharacterized membrane protein